ncbi:hypothetical protein [Amycolatopsis cihanbeyliensis]|uniref:hypothetical protein n=1 Tax=Amycolatopsis cihanbeyliensis TaxID=1128664 RepID=UPI00115235CC|nr:hypothetical protein [Amycolatopsis cihanbeyliensis]
MLSPEWFDPDVLADAAEVISGKLIGFGAAAAMTAVTKQLLAALGIPDAVLDPLRLPPPPDEQDLWRPQELGVFNLVMAFPRQAGYCRAQPGAGPGLDGSCRRLASERGPLPLPGLLTPARRTVGRLPVPAQPCSGTRGVHRGQQPAHGGHRPAGNRQNQTATAIMADAWRRGETVVLSSTNNKPVDDVVTSKATQLDRACRAHRQ